MAIADELRQYADKAIKEGGMYFSGNYLDGLAKRAESEQAENAKLRELVADMWFWHYEGHIDSESRKRQMLHINAVIQSMRELGIEVG